MRVATANAIKTLLRSDTTVTSDVRTAIISIIVGQRAAKAVKVDFSVDFKVPEAADFLGMSRCTLWRMCERGAVDAVRRGRKFYIPGREVARLKGVTAVPAAVAADDGASVADGAAPSPAAVEVQAESGEVCHA